MKPALIPHHLIVIIGSILVSAFFTSCEKTVSGNPEIPVEEKPMIPNRPPVANAGADQYLWIGPSDPYIALSSYGTTDPDHNITEYLWKILSGLTGKGLALSGNTVSYSPNEGTQEGIYTIELQVTDAGGLTSRDTLNVQVLFPKECDLGSRPKIMARLVKVGNLSEPKVGMSVASAENKIFFAGASVRLIPGSPLLEYGSDRVEIFDLATHTCNYSQLRSIRSNVTTVAAKNKIFFAGGRLGDGSFDELFDDVDIYDLSKNSWTSGRLSEARYNIASTTLGTKVFFAGGVKDPDYQASGRVDIYDLAEGEWNTAQLSQPRANLSAVTDGKKVFFAGGHSDNIWHAAPSIRIDIFDEISNSWEQSTLKAPLGFITGVWHGDKLFWSEKCIMHVLDLKTFVTRESNLSRPATWNSSTGQTALIKDDKIVFLKLSARSFTFDIYDTRTQSWYTGVLPHLLPLLPTVISVDNKIYIAGGDAGIPTDQIYRLEF